MAMASALPAGGRVVTCEVDPDHAAVARRHIEASPWRERIDLRIGDALETIARLEGPFDLVFIDADKVNYRNYFDAVLPKLSEGGVIAVDNVLWAGRVLQTDLSADPRADDTKAIIDFNDAIVRDDRFECVMLTVRDGVTLIRRR
jgi:caffeoyl-CoA O-methyltransferase